MGAPKLKWTSEEEEALRAGIAKHGTGKWKTIIKDPEFSSVLHSRSNVDLKDKWRNINVFSTHGGSREKAREAIKRNQQQQQQQQQELVDEIEKALLENDDDNQTVVVYEEKPLVVFDGTVKRVETEEAVDAKPVGYTSAPLLLPPPTSSKRKITRLDNLVLEAIASLKEPRGSNKTSISMYIEDQYDAPPDFSRVLSEMLKSLTESGKVIKVNHKYRIAPPSASFSQTRSSAEALPNERQTDFSKTEKVQMRYLSQVQVDAELEKFRSMTAHEAASAAARAVAEAEAAMAEAEQAEIDALAAEADAEEAQAFAEAAVMTLKSINTSNLMIRA